MTPSIYKRESYRQQEERMTWLGRAAMRSYLKRLHANMHGKPRTMVRVSSNVSPR